MLERSKGRGQTNLDHKLEGAGKVKGQRPNPGLPRLEANALHIESLREKPGIPILEAVAFHIESAGSETRATYIEAVALHIELAGAYDWLLVIEANALHIELAGAYDWLLVLEVVALHIESVPLSGITCLISTSFVVCAVLKKPQPNCIVYCDSFLPITAVTMQLLRLSGQKK